MDVSSTTSLNRVISKQSETSVSPTPEKTPEMTPEKSSESGTGLPIAGNDEPQKPESQAVKEAVQQIQNFLANTQRQLKFNVDEQSGRTVITVVNSQTQEIIRQIPSEEVLNIAASLEQSGLQLFDDLV